MKNLVEQRHKHVVPQEKEALVPLMQYVTPYFPIGQKKDVAANPATHPTYKIRGSIHHSHHIVVLFQLCYKKVKRL